MFHEHGKNSVRIKIMLIIDFNNFDNYNYCIHLYFQVSPSSYSKGYVLSCRPFNVNCSSQESAETRHPTRVVENGLRTTKGQQEATQLFEWDDGEI